LLIFLVSIVVIIFLHLFIYQH